MPRDSFGGVAGGGGASGGSYNWFQQNPGESYYEVSPGRRIHRSEVSGPSQPGLAPTPAPSSWTPPPMPSYQGAAPGPMITPAIQQQPQENSMWTNVWGTQYNMWGGLSDARKSAISSLFGGGG